MNVTLSLDGQWKLAVDPDNIGVGQEWYAAEKTPPCIAAQVPGIVATACPGFLGVAWYFKTFETEKKAACRYFLEFDAVNQECEVWLNETVVGSSGTGYTPFGMEVTDELVDGGNYLAVRTLDAPAACVPGDGAEAAGPIELVETPCGNEAGGLNFQGVWGGVRLRRTGNVRIESVVVFAPFGADRVEVSVVLDAKTNPGQSEFLFTISTDGADPATVCARTFVREILQGEIRLVFELEVANARPWELDSPALYRLTLAVSDSDSFTTRFGFRTFEVERNRFKLNGREIQLRGVTLPTAYPVLIGLPSDEKRLSDELRKIRKTGFNAVRTHLRPALPRTLEIADEIGLLVYEEPSIGRIRFSGDIEKRCNRALADMVRRDINHPSLALWGVLNETGTYGHDRRRYPLGALTIKRNLVSHVLRNDKSRPVVDDSGGEEFSHEPSRVYGPGLAEEGEECRSYHIFSGIPPSRTFIEYLDSLGSDDQLTVIGQLGCPVMTDIRSAIDGYDAADRGLVCYASFTSERERIEHWLHRSGLRRAFPSSSELARALWPASADCLEKLVRSVRANGRIAGFFLERWADAPGDFGKGLVGAWNRSKPVLAAVGRALAPLYLYFTVNPPNPRLGEEFEVGVFLLSDTGWSGRGRLIFRLGGNEIGSADVEIDGRSEVGKFQFTNSETHGVCELAVTLERADCDDLEAVSVMHFEKIEPITPERGTVQVFTHEDDPLLREFSPLNTKLPGNVVILVPRLANTMFAYPERRLREVLKKIFNGSVGIFFDIPTDANVFFREVIGLEIEVLTVDSGRLGVQHIAPKNVLFEGLRGDAGLGPEYIRTAPKYAFLIPRGETLAGAFSPGALADDALRLADVKCVPYGQGRLIFSSYRLIDAFSTDSCARRLLENHINTAAGYLKRSPQLLDETNSKDLARLAKYHFGRTQKWTVLSPPVGGDPCVNFQRVFPIEANPLGEYAGIVCHTSRGQKTVDLSFLFPFSRRHVTFLYTDFVAPKPGPRQFVLGASGSVKLWVNGEIVFNLHKHQPTILEPNLINADLKKGPNRIFAKVENVEAKWDFFFEPVGVV